MTTAADDNIPETTAQESAAANPRAVTQGVATIRERRDQLFSEQLSLPDDDDSLGDVWSIPWSDLMMVMFVLFAALLVANAMNPKIEIRYKTRPIPEIHEIEKEKLVERQVPERQPSFEPLMQINVFDHSQDAILETQMHNIDVALLEDQSVKVSVRGPMFFERGKVDLLPDMIKFLDRLASVIKQTPFQVHVIGHTDDNPISTAIFPSNWELSLHRASQVARHLIASGSIDPKRFVVMGRGQYDPAFPNDDEEFRALNRRVEIIITREIATVKNTEQ